MKIIVGTKNQTKIDIVTSIVKQVLHVDIIEVIDYDAESGVPEAPHNEETYEGARNRAVHCRDTQSADYYIGIESGLVERYGNLFEEAWAVIITSDDTHYVGYSSGLLLPAVVRDRMESGDKHNEIMAYYDQLFNLPNDNRDTWSRYTGGAISRRISLEEAVRNALIQTVQTERSLYRHA